MIYPVSLYQYTTHITHVGIVGMSLIQEIPFSTNLVRMMLFPQIYVILCFMKRGGKERRIQIKMVEREEMERWEQDGVLVYWDENKMVEREEMRTRWCIGVLRWEQDDGKRRDENKMVYWCIEKRTRWWKEKRWEQDGVLVYWEENKMVEREEMRRRWCIGVLRREQDGGKRRDENRMGDNV